MPYKLLTGEARKTKALQLREEGARADAAAGVAATAELDMVAKNFQQKMDSKDKVEQAVYHKFWGKLQQVLKIGAREVSGFTMPGDVAFLAGMAELADEVAVFKHKECPNTLSVGAPAL